MSQPYVLASPPLSVAVAPALLGEQTMSSLFANIVHVYRHQFRVLVLCCALPMFPLLLFMELLKVLGPIGTLLGALPELVGSFIVSGGADGRVVRHLPWESTDRATQLCAHPRWEALVVPDFDRPFVLAGGRSGFRAAHLAGPVADGAGLFSAIIVALEGRRSLDALRRSIALTKGQAWRIIGASLPTGSRLFWFLLWAWG